MKALKIILLSILSIFIIIYMAFLFVLPYAIDLNQYSPLITKEIEKSTGFKVSIKDLKVKTAWNLSGGAKIAKTDLSYPTGEKFGQINDLEVRLSLIPLLFGQAKLDSVKADKLFLNLGVEPNGKFVLEKYLSKTPAEQTAAPMPLKVSDSMPDVKINTYRISFIDSQSKKSYSIKGEDFKIWDFILNKKIKAKAKGDIVLADRKQITYDLMLSSKVFPPATTNQSPQAPSINIMTIFKDLYKYNLCSNINANLKLTGTPEDTKIDGNLDLDKISFTINGKKLPQSNLNLRFNGEKISINSHFYTDINEKALITGEFKNGKNKYINIKVISDKTDIGNTFLIANTLLQLAGIKDLQGISANGHVNANFNIKSDFKKIQSDGYLKIDNANIVHNLYKVALNSIIADIDFSSNKVNIKKSSAKINGEPISLNGSIDTDANADLSIFAQNLQLQGLLATLGQIQTLKENDINSGLIDLQASLKGRLDKATPTVDVNIKNVNLKNKPNKAQINLTNAKIKMTSNGKKTNGKATVNGLKILSQGKLITAQNAGLSFNEKDLKIDNGIIYLNNSRIDIFGSVKDYATKKINFDITAKGLIFANDIKSMLPPQNKSGVVAKGKIPLLVRITGSQSQKIHAQMLANNTNYISILDINSLRGKTSLINAELFLSGNELKIDEITLYSITSNKGLSQNMSANSESGTKIITLNGALSNITSQTPYIKGINIKIPQQISTSIPGYKNSLIQAKGDLNINGASNNPDIKGYLTLPSISLPTLKTNLKDLILQFNNNSIVLNCPLLKIDNSIMSFNSVIDKNFSKGVVIKNIDFGADFLDLDSLGAAMANLPQNANGPGTDLGVIIVNGKGNIQKVKTGGLVATNATSNFTLYKNILKMGNVQANAYFGKIAGIITYDLIYGKVGLDIQGRMLSAEPTLKALAGLPQAPSGKLDFDSDITMVGYTPEQLIQSLKGNTKFIISNGKMGKLGQLEHLLYAQNILSNNFFRATLNVIAKALTVKNTGSFKYIKGEMTFNQGWANLAYIKTSGPSMSMYITGRFNLLNNSANLIVLGRLSDEIVKVMGPIGELSMDKMLSFIPKLGQITSVLINQMTTDPEYENTSLIPPLSPETSLPTKDFKVVINGGIDSQSSVKSFKWLSKPSVAQAQPTNIPQVNQAAQEVKNQIQQGARQILQQVAPTTKQLPTNYGQQNGYKSPIKVAPPVADFINSLPDLR